MRALLRIAFAGLALLFSALLGAQTQAQPALQIPAGAQAGANFDPEVATNAWLAMVPPERKAQSDAYFEGGYWLILLDLLYGAAISILLLATRVSARMRDRAKRFTARPALVAWIYWLQYSLAVFVLAAPLAIYEGYTREHQYGLSNQTFGAWSGDQFKALGLTIVFGGIVVMVLLAIVRRLPQTWHLWGAGSMIAFELIATLFFPVFIAPLFNTYKVLDDLRIRDPILRVARENGIPVNNVYEVDASRQSKRISANVSGFLGTERITLNDNLLNRCSLECTVAVMGHEMGHYVMNHVYKMMAFTAIIQVFFFAALRWGLLRSVARCGSRLDIHGVADPAVLPLAILILSILGLVFTPVNNTLLRVQEYEADVFGLNSAREPDGFAQASLLLGEYRKLEPGPVEEFIFFDHPSGRTRIFTSMRWKAENLCVRRASQACRRPE